jgi:hypothetical protein
VSLRRITTVVATFVVALGVAVAVPVSQLRTISFKTWCCCGDPAHCHCPKKKPSHSTQPSMTRCHHTSVPIVAPDAPSFTATEVALVTAPARAAAVIVPTIPAPQAPPAPPRPDAPS